MSGDHPTNWEFSDIGPSEYHLNRDKHIPIPPDTLQRMAAFVHAYYWNTKNKEKARTDMWAKDMEHIERLLQANNAGEGGE